MQSETYNVHASECPYDACVYACVGGRRQNIGTSWLYEVLMIQQSRDALTEWVNKQSISNTHTHIQLGSHWHRRTWIIKYFIRLRVTHAYMVRFDVVTRPHTEFDVIRRSIFAYLIQAKWTNSLNVIGCDWASITCQSIPFATRVNAQWNMSGRCCETRHSQVSVFFWKSFQRRPNAITTLRKRFVSVAVT